jgi:hypothetical protein
MILSQYNTSQYDPNMIEYPLLRYHLDISNLKPREGLSTVYHSVHLESQEKFF